MSISSPAQQSRNHPGQSPDTALQAGQSAVKETNRAGDVAQKKPHMPLLFVTLLAAIAPLSWGTTYLVTTAFLPEGHPFFAGLMRALPAGIIAILIGRKLPRGVWIWRSILLGLLNIGFFFPLLFISAGHLPGGVAATLGAVQPLFVIFLALPLLGEKVLPTRLLLAIVGTVGVGLVVLGKSAGMDTIGVIAGLAGTASMATGVVLTKKWGRAEGTTAISMVGWQLTAGGLFLLPLTLLLEGFPSSLTATNIGGYLWLGLVGGLIAYALWFWAIGQLPVSRAALLGYLSPLMAAFLGTVVSGERFGPLQILGLVLAFGAMLVGQFGRRPSALHGK